MMSEARAKRDRCRGSANSAAPGSKSGTNARLSIWRYGFRHNSGLVRCGAPGIRRCAGDMRAEKVQAPPITRSKSSWSNREPTDIWDDYAIITRAQKASWNAACPAAAPFPSTNASTALYHAPICLRPPRMRCCIDEEQDVYVLLLTCPEIDDAGEVTMLEREQTDLLSPVSE
jgi:hypothetical protein